MAVKEAIKIAALNDEFRRHGYGLLVTRGALGLEDVEGLLREVRLFDTFTGDNDPYGEHDFGSVIWKDETVLWKIDYYDLEMKYGEDALSPNCRRVLTVMLASEY
jgi:hypothetical protein